MITVLRSQSIMLKEPQKSYLDNGVTYQSNKEKMQPEKTARFWGQREQFVYVNKLNMICKISNGEIKPLIEALGWIDHVTSSKSHGSTMCFVSATEEKPEAQRKIALVSLSEPCYSNILPDLPGYVHAPGLVNTGTHIYVIGGWKNVVGGAMESMTSVNRWCLINNNWETCPSSLEAVVNPISVSNNQYIFVIGSYKEEDLSCKVQRYNTDTSEWTSIAELPRCVDNCSAFALI